jgi:hypothetical protein
VRIARALVAGPAAPGALELALDGATAAPAAPRISEGCARLLEDALRRAWHGVALRHGGGRPPPWRRLAPQPLPFTGASLALLQWIARAGASPAAAAAAPPLAALSGLGDQLLLWLALEALDGSPGAVALAAEPAARAAPLAWLGFPDLIAAAGAGAPAPSCSALVRGAGAVLLEALGPPIARRWRALEERARAAVVPQPLIAQGAVHDAALTSLLAACDGAARRDLAGLVIDAAAPLLAAGRAPTPARLDPRAPLAARTAARRAAGALLRAVLVWAAWDREHRGVRYIDDGYAEAQALLARFEPIGAAGAARAAAWLAELAALPAADRAGPDPAA